MKHFNKTFIITLAFAGIMLLSNDSKAQITDTLFKKVEDFGDFLLYRNHDTNYISNYGDKVAVKLVAISKYNYFRIRDREKNSTLRYRPVRDVSIGAGVSYKWFALDITISLGLNKNSELENTQSFDFQGAVFSSKQYISGTLQYYRAYQLNGITGADDANVSDSSKRREDLRTINFGLQYLFAINYTRFSLKAPFVLNEVQKKSAGSIIFGAGFSFFSIAADSSIVPSAIKDYFNPNLYLDDQNILTLSANIGYMYSFVVKEHFFLTLSAIPGLSLNAGDYHTVGRIYVPPGLNFNFISMNALGYNGNKFFTGLQFIINTNFTRLGKKIGSETGHGKISFYVGYRIGR